jgi:hypothetical protein
MRFALRFSSALSSLALALFTLASSAAEPPAPDSPAATVPPALSATPPAVVEEKPADPLPIPRDRLYLASLTIVRYNPLGLETQNRLVFQHRLLDSESLLLRDTFVSGAASLKLSPAYIKVGPTVEIQPVAALNLRAGYEFLGYFGSLGFLQSFPDAARDYSDDARKITESAAYSTTGHHVFFEPTLQARVKSLAVRSKLAVEYWSMGLGGGDTVFYDATLDTLVPNKGWILSSDTDLVYSIGRLTFGARFSGVWPIYGKEHWGAAGEPAGFGGNSHMRLGPIAAFSFNTREYSSFNKPTLLAIAGWYLDHPNREGALPYLLLGFSFSSDFLAAR